MASSEIRERRFPDPPALNAALAQEITRALQHSLDAGRGASLAVPGGRTPVGLFELLSQSAIAWQRVGLTLTDERWVDPAGEGSNEHLVRTHLLRGAAAAARLASLWNAAPDARQGADASWAALACLPRPFDFVLLGMGDDGHFASLFPGSPGLAAALDPQRPPGCVAMRAPVAPAERLSLTLSALLDARQIALLIVGEAKRAVLQRALQDGPETELPVRALLRQRRTPVSVYWSP
jgi:6-phosphogluconolactonase